MPRALAGSLSLVTTCHVHDFAEIQLGWGDCWLTNTHTHCVSTPYTHMHTPASLIYDGDITPSSSTDPDRNCHRRVRRPKLLRPTNDDSKTHQSSLAHFLTIRGLRGSLAFLLTCLKKRKMISCRQKETGTRELKRKVRVADRDISKSIRGREESRVLEDLYNLWRKNRLSHKELGEECHKN